MAVVVVVDLVVLAVDLVALMVQECKLQTHFHYMQQDLVEVLFPYATSFYEYPLLGQAPVNPGQPFGSGGSGANVSNRSLNRNNGYVMIHCFSSNFVPSLTDLPENLGGYTVTTP